MEDSQIIDLYWARLEQAIQETDTKYGGYCPCDCPQYFEEHGRQRGMRVGHVAARLERDAAAAAFGSLGVFGTHHAQSLARPLQSRARGKTRRKQLSGGARRAVGVRPAGGSMSRRWTSASWGRQLTGFCAPYRKSSAVCFCAGTGMRVDLADCRALLAEGEHRQIHSVPHARAAAQILAEGGRCRMTRQDRQEKLFRAIGYVGDDLIQRADAPAQAERKQPGCVDQMGGACRLLRAGDRACVAPPDFPGKKQRA